MLSDTTEQNYNFKGFMALFSSQAFSLLGSSIVSFIIIWYLTIETGSALVLSLATIAGMVPMLVLAPFAGVLTDRLNRKFVLFSTDFIQALATLGLMYLFYINQAEVFHVLLLLTVRGIAQAFQMPAFSTLPAIMVQKERIPKVNALNSLLNSLIFIASPGIGAVLLGYFSIGTLLWIDLVTYAPAFFVLFFVKIKDVRKKFSESEKRPSFITDFKEGISYIRTSGLLPLIASFSVISIFLNPLFSLIPLLITDVHLGNQNDLAFVEILAHVGMLVGSLVILLWKGFKPTFNKVFVFALFLLFSMLAMAVTPAQMMILLGITIFFAGLSISLTDVQFMSLLQLIVPPELQGRVFTSLFTMMKSFVPIALIGWGIIAEFTGIHFVFVIAPIIAIFLMIIMIYFSQLRFLDKKFEKQNLTNISVEVQAVVL